VTWVEVVLCLSGAGLVLGVAIRRRPFGRWLMVVCAVVIGALLATYGREFVEDFF
jgi:hypothetical protein